MSTAGDEKPLNLVSIKRRLKAGRDLVQLDVCHCCGEEKIGVREVFFNPGNGPEGAGQLMCQDCIDDEEKQGRYYE